jgi:hypothetical protein
MTDARLRRLWHRAGSLAALGAIAVIAAAPGCSSDPKQNATSSSGAAGGPSFEPAANGLSAFDTTPDPDGTTLYFTALAPGSDGELAAGVFKAPADGSAQTPVAVAVGDPFSSPFGISISGDGKHLFVADSGADAGGEKGAIFVVPADGGTPTALAGTEDAIPRSLEVVEEAGKDVIYFTGTDKSDGQAGVFKIAASGGALTVVAKGGLFRDPSGIAIAKDGTVYVADTISSDSETADILVITPGGAPTQLLSGIRVGYPCGIALTKADTALLVSALDPSTLTDIVIIVDLSSKTPSTIAPDAINKFSEAAGLHRARNTDVFGWADSSGGKNGGIVFTVK